MRLRYVTFRFGHMLAVPLAVAISACDGVRLGNPDGPAGVKLGDLLNLGTPKNADDAAASGRIHCPDIRVLEGTAAARFHAGSPPSNANLRYQYALNDVARECSREGDKILIKVGIAGKVLLGPAGSPGTFSVPARVAILRQSDDTPVVSKLYRGNATIGAGETQADFTIISEPLQVPFIQDHAEFDYTIKVGIDNASPSESVPGNSPRSRRHREG